jgi:gamma-glutamylcyclotransferase (GGCT)/AIG2-like uncharacterized protein YtfP
MLDLGPFPAVVEGKGPIEGEVYEVDSSLLERIDLLEGHPNLYIRKQAQTINSLETVNYYEFKKAEWLLPTVITSGVWRKK